MATPLILLLKGESGGGGWSGMIMIGLIFIVFYFFMIRPQMKKAKKEREFQQNLQKDEKVVTSGGIHGKILEIKDASVILGLEDGQRIRVDKDKLSAEASAQLSEEQNK
ncbi:MAG: preprotein translocase subunit YajC [Flavobacteriales bacterium]